MTELMMPDFLGAMNAGLDRGKKQGLAQLYGQAMNASPEQRGGLLAKIAGSDGQFAMQAQKSFDEQDDDVNVQMAKRAGQVVAMFKSNPQMAQQMYVGGFLPLAARAGVGQGASQTLDESMIPGLTQLSMAGQAAGNVQSTYIDGQGNRVAIMRDGSTQVLGQNAPNNQILGVGNAAGGTDYNLVNKGNGQYSPIVPQGQSPQPQQPGPQSGQPFTIDPSLPPEVRASIRNNEQAWASAPDGGEAVLPPANRAPSGQVPGQLVSAPKPQAQPTQLQINADQRDSERLRLAQQAAVNKDALVAGAADAKRVATEAKQAAAVGRQAAAKESASSLVAAIDQLTGSPGFGDLGTVWGDAKLNTPLVRNDAKDADAQLKNVAGKVALATMSQLRTLSAAGATGFGALTAPELTLLQNSIATLQAEKISNAQLKTSLTNIKKTMQKITGWKPQQQNQPATGGFRILPD